jgi:Chaperone of endosialidase
MTTPAHNFDVNILSPFSSAVAISGIPISSVPPTNGQALVYNSAINQFQYAPIPTPTGFVDLTSAQTITGVKTIATDLQFSPGAVITQGANTFTLPTSSGALATAPIGGALVDTTSAQSISGVKTITTDLQFGPGAVITQGANSFAFPASGGTLAASSAGNPFIDTASPQTITGIKTIASDLQFGAGAVITQGANSFAFPASGGTLVTTAPGNPLIDTSSAQTITGVKTIATDLQFGAGAVITQGANTFTLPAASGTLATNPASGSFVDTTSAQTITGVKTIATDLQFGAGAVITQGANTFNLPAASGTLVTAAPGNPLIDTTSAQTITGVKTIATDLQFGAGAVITQGANTFTFPNASGEFELEPTTTNTPEGLNAIDSVTTGLGNTGIGANALTALTTGNNNVAVGLSSLAALTTGSSLTAVGTNSLAANTTGTSNVADGFNSLAANTTGSNNTAVGSTSLAANTIGSSNVAIGMSALAANTTGQFNVAIGNSALGSDVSGTGETAVGFQALASNTTGTSNSAVGFGTLSANTTGSNNAADGSNALSLNTTGSNNTAVGATALMANTTASGNTAVGANTLKANVVGTNNVAVGVNALTLNTSDLNTAVGSATLAANTTGSSNVAVGSNALTANTSGFGNVAVGLGALQANTAANSNVAVGYLALSSNTTGFENVSIGRDSMSVNTTGAANVAVGFDALSANTTGNNNTAVGWQALQSATTGGSNVAVGYLCLDAAVTGSGNTCVGATNSNQMTTGARNTTLGNNTLVTLTTGVQNVAIGAAVLDSLTTGSNNTVVGYNSGVNYTGAESGNVIIQNGGVVGDAGAIRIGTNAAQTSCFIQGINGVIVAGAVPALVGPTGQLGTVVSSRRFKEDVVPAKDYDISKLQVVNFRYKGQDKQSVGLIAEDVEQVLPELVVYDLEGMPQTVQYMDFIPILLQRVQKLEQLVETLKSVHDQLHKE